MCQIFNMEHLGVQKKSLLYEHQQSNQLCAADTKDREVKEQINRSKKKKKKIHINTSDS